MTSHRLAGVHFRDTSEYFHLTGAHFVLHPQLISCIHGQLLQNYFCQSVPLSMIFYHFVTLPYVKEKFIVLGENKSDLAADHCL